MLLETSQLSLMQGRLVKPIHKPIQEFPYKNWKEELNSLPSIGLFKIEWIIDEFSFKENPLLISNQDVEILLKGKGLQISAVSNDYFLDIANGFRNINFSNLYEAISKQEELIYKLGENKEYILVMPFIENASLQNLTPRETEKLFNKLLSFKSNFEINFALELDIDYLEILKKLPDYLGNKVFINLDVGNTVSYGYDIFEEIEKLSDLIINVHLKDRKIGGPTLPLGSGDADIKQIIRCLIENSYNSNFTLQFARKYNDEFKTIKEYLDVIKNYE